MAETKVEGNDTTKITLIQEFGWLFDKEFTKLREGFRPIDNFSYLTTREKIVLEEMEKLENNISSITTMEGSNRLVPKQSLYDLLKSDGFQDDNSINAIIYSLMHKGKIYEFKAEEDGDMFYGIVSEGDENNNSDCTQEQDPG
jgi:hypothetical protein